MSESDMWKGIAIYEAFESFKTPGELNVLGSRQERLEGECQKSPVHFYSVAVSDEDLERVTNWARETLRPGWYMHLVKKGRMRVIFRNYSLDVSIDDPKSIERARRYGVEVGVHPEQLPLEDLFHDPFA